MAERPQAINYAGVSAMLKLAKHVEINFASMTKRSSEWVGVSDWAKPRLTIVTPAEQNNHRTHDLALFELMNETVVDFQGHFTAHR